MKQIWLVLLLPSFAFAMRDPIGAPPDEISTSWTYLPPHLKSMGRCDEIFATREPSFSLRIVSHQNWVRFLHNSSADPSRLRRAKLVESLYAAAGPTILEAIPRITEDEAARAAWRMRLGLTSSPIPDIKDRLQWLSRLNHALIEKDDNFLDSVSGPLIQVMRNLKVFTPGEVEERPIDMQAFSVMKQTVLELRDEPELGMKIEQAVAPRFRDSPGAAFVAIRKLNALRELLPSRFKTLMEHLNTLQGRFNEASRDIEEKRYVENSPSISPSIVSAMEDEDHLGLSQPDTAGSLELAQRDNYHEMIIYLQEIRSAAQLARMDATILRR